MAMPLPLPDGPEPGDVRDDRAHDGPVGPMTFEEYLDHVGEGDTIHEYVDGMVYAKGTGTFAHATLSFNIAASLRVEARRAACQISVNSFAVRTADGRGYVPDVMVHCGPRPTNEDRYVEQACVLVEVLSPSTRRVDMREKLAAYREIAGVHAYWIVEATWRCVHRHWRDADGHWHREDVTGDAAVSVPCLSAPPLTLDEIYADLDLPRDLPRPHLTRVREPEAAYEVGEEVPDEAGSDAVHAAPAHGC